MFKNYVKIALRNFLKHKGFSFINVFGLAIGVTCCLLIVLYVLDEVSYDKYHEKADQIYRVGILGFVNNNQFHGVVTPAPMAQTLVDEYPEVTAATRLRNLGFPVFRYEDKVFSEERVFWVDQSFFDVFTVPFIKGDPKTALAQPNTIVLTRSMALKYFGDEDPMGKSLNADQRRDYLVTGVVEDISRNSHFHYDFLASLVTVEDSRRPIWVSNNYYTYLVLQEGTSPEAFEPKLAELVRKYVGPQIQQAAGITLEQFFASGGKWDYFIQPLTDIHLRSHLDYELEANGDIAYVYIFSIIAIGILLVACINFVNLATARAATRAREVGIRKTVGSNRGQLIRQFLSETTLTSFFAVLLALIAVQFLLPLFNTITGKELAIPYFQNVFTIPLLLALVLFIGILAGTYPAFFLASFDPVVVLKTEMSGRSKKSSLRNVLVVFQFTVSVVLIVGTVIVSRQLSYIQNRNLGFNKEQIVIVKKTDDIGNQVPAFRQELLKNPNIINASNTNNLIGNEFGNSAHRLAGATGEETHLLWTYITDPHFAETYQVEMAAGRYYEEGRQADQQNVVINEATAKEFGLKDPIGKQIVALAPTPEQSVTTTIIGVMKNFHFKSLHHQIGPLIVYLFRPEGRGRYVSVRVHSENIRETMAYLEDTWRKFASNQAFEYEFFDDHFASIYQAEERTGQIFFSFSLLAIIIASLGLFGLAAFVAEQRTKEIGIRKVLGATETGIVFLLSKQFTKWVILSNLFAWPIAYYFMQRWLQRFAYQASISVWSFFFAFLVVLFLALLTVSYQTVKAARSNPVELLRYE
ncbi:MAG: FtsX-like permease family protein [Candidatus Aminicenantes bacterium]|nr:FtsX-like permease family protein [Candidatus Aminicenantes bacterium]